MRRALAVLTLAAGFGLAAARPASAQGTITFYFGVRAADTATALMPGVVSDVPLRLGNPTYYSYPYWRVQYARIHLYFDPAQVEVLAVLPEPGGGFTTVDSANIGTGVVSIAADGQVAGTDAPALRLRMRLLSGVTNGVYLWMRADSVAGYSDYSGYQVLSGATRIGQMCHATQVWGDVDASGSADSRDALIVLSSAVGLPVTGFSLGMGDVDGDGLANSRDALMILSYAIGLSTSSATGIERAGEGIPDACPGLTPPGETVVFRRAGTASGIFLLAPASTAATQVTADPSHAWPRLDAGDSTVAFECNPNICLTAPDGSNLRTLTDTVLMLSPDWSPDGANIAFIEVLPGGVPTLSTMDTTGGNRNSIKYGTELPRRVAWSHDSTKVVYPDSSQGQVRSLTMDALHTPQQLALSPAPTADLARWSPGDSLVAYTTVGLGPILGVPASGGGTPRTLVSFPGTRAFDWGPAGLIFSMPDAHGVQSLWLLQGGPAGPLVRLTNPGSGQADDQPSFRRTP